MKWFSEFSNLAWFTIAIVVTALVSGVLALTHKKKSKLILVIAGIIEAILLIAAVTFFFIDSNLGGVAFRDIELSPVMYALLIAAVIVIMFAVAFLSARKEKWTAKDIASASICITMSFILSYIKLFEMPQGGTITPASLLPMMVYVLAYGPSRGLVVGFAYGLLQLVQGAYIVHPAQMLMDYPIAFGSLALGGFVRYMKVPRAMKLPLAVMLGYFGRYVCAVLSGVIFFAEYAGSQNVWVYSSVYNITYIGAEALVCAVISAIPAIGRLPDVLRKKSN